MQHLGTNNDRMEKGGFIRPARKTAFFALIGALVWGVASQAEAIPMVSLHPANAGITSLSYTVTGGTIDIFETWGNGGRGFLAISGLDLGTTYTVNKHITNLSGIDWTRFSNELLDPAGNQNDLDRDILPYPDFVPAGFSTSNDDDGLSFRTGRIPPTSSSFSQVFIDVSTDARDFVDFFNGRVSGAGGTDLITFGLRNIQSENEPFLLAQRPNESVAVVPIPPSLFLFMSGLVSMSLIRRGRVEMRGQATSR